MDKEPWSYNPTSYYLLIFKKTKIMAHAHHTSAYDATSQLLNWSSSDEMSITKKLKPGIDLLQKEMNNILCRHFSNAIQYDDGTFGVIFSTKWIDKGRKDRVASVDKMVNDPIVNDIYSFIISLERDRKLINILK